MRILILICFFAASCNTTTSETNDYNTHDVIEKDSIPFIDKGEHNTILNPITNKLVEVTSFPYKDSISYHDDNKSIVLTKQDWIDFEYSTIEDYNISFQYASYGYFYTNDQLYLLISRDYTEETIHWLCAVDENLHLIDHLMIAYDNSEGFYACNSEIQMNNYLKIINNSYEFDKNETKKYKFFNNEFTLMD